MKSGEIYVFGEKFDSIDENVFSFIEKKIPELKHKIYHKNTSDIIDILEQAGKVFSDEKSTYYKLALDDLRKNVKFSEPMIKATLSVVPHMLSKKSIEKRMNLEMIYPTAVESAVLRDGYNGVLKAYPVGVVFHVGAGNVFIGILDSLLCGIITKNVNIVKVSSKGSNFMNLFAQLLCEIDRKRIISDNFAILKWKGGDSTIEDRIVSFSDLIFVWGGYDVAEYYKKNTPFYVNVEIFGPKTSFAVVSEEYLMAEGYKNVSKKIVKDCAMWDQGACSNMHDLYVVCSMKNRDRIIKNLMREIENSFVEFEQMLPCGKIDEDEMVEIIKARELAKVDKAYSKAEVLLKNNKFTVIYEKDPSYRISPLNRTLYLKAVCSTDEIKNYIKPYRHYLQTVGLGLTSAEKYNFINSFYDSGITRFCDIGKMTEGEDGSPHDGRFVLSRLVRWVGVETSHSADSRVVEFVNYAKENIDFYKKFYGKINVKNIDDFRKLPFLTKDHLIKNSPPRVLSMLDKSSDKGIYFASGGSTGHPKYVFYSQDEYENVCKMLAEAYKEAGIEKGDVIANLFVGGNLWSSFLSVEKAISHIDAVSVPIGSSLSVDNVVRYLSEFNVNVIVGLPSFLIKLAGYVKENKIKLKINKILYGGEYITDEMIDFFKEVFGGKCIVKSAGYATADAGVIGFQCRYLDKGAHHLFYENQYLEIINPSTLKPVKTSEIGEVVVTCLLKKKMPLIRYRVGDLARWLDFKCKCGSNAAVFEIVGRCDDRIHVGGAHLFVWDVQKAISSVKGLSFNFQIIIDKKGVRDFIEIVVESPLYKKAKELSEQLLVRIIENCQDLAESIKMGWIEPPSIRIVPPDTIKRIERTGKIKKVVDKRINI